MKKGLLMVALVLFLAGCDFQKDAGFQKTTTDVIINKVSQKETFAVMITNDDCYSCDVFQEESETLLEENNKMVLVLNTADMDESQIDQIHIALGEHTTWPALYLVDEGEVPATNKYEYSLDPEGWKTWMQNMNLIKKE